MVKDKESTEIDALESIAVIFRIVGIVLAALAVILGIFAVIKHNGRLGVAVGVIGIIGVAVIAAASQFRSTTYADRLGETSSTPKRKSTPSHLPEERFVRSTNASEDQKRSEMVVENFRNAKKLPECACKVKLNDGEVCHYSTPGRFDKTTSGTMMVTSHRLIFVAKGIFNAADLKSLTQLIKYDSGSIGVATKQSLLPEVYEVSYPGEFLTFTSLACMARGVQAPPIEHV
jgi:hypothetical protein